jgi:hypothetical protein
MEMWISGDRLGTEHFPLSTDKQKRFSMVTGDCISGVQRRTNSFFVRHSSLGIRKSFLNQNQVSHSRSETKRETDVIQSEWSES